MKMVRHFSKIISQLVNKKFAGNYDKKNQLQTGYEKINSIKNMDDLHFNRL